MTKDAMHPLFEDFCSFDNVVGLGHGNKRVRGEITRQKSIVFLVRKKYSTSQLNRSSIIPKKIDGVFTDVIEVGDITFQDLHKQKLRPAQPGVSIGHYKISAGTLGAVVQDRNSKELLLLSNNHVLANLTDGSDNRSIIGDKILQPGTFDGGDKENDVIGYLSRFIPIHKDSSNPRCKYAILFESIMNKIINLFRPHYRIGVIRETELINTVDCAVATPVLPDSISPNILEIGEVIGCKDATPGMMVKKSGRSSGVTHSIVLATDVTFKIGVNPQESAIFCDQILTGPLSVPGDSGSLVLSEDNYAIGLLFAGSDQATMCNKISNVLQALDIEFCNA